MNKGIMRAGFLLGALVFAQCNLGCARDGALKVESFVETPGSRESTPAPPVPRSVFRSLSYGIVQVGDTAPRIEVGEWLNVDEAALRTGPQLNRKVVLVEFWGTWCPSCVRAMPQIQRLHDRYRDWGLVVVAVSYEDTKTLNPFLKKNAYTMPVASDTEQRCTMAYGVNSWPTTVLIDRKGKIAYVGHSDGIEPVIQEALGVRLDPSVLLMRYLDVVHSKRERVIHDVLFPLAQRSRSDFNLRKWAVFAGGVAAEDGDKMVDGEQALRKIVEGRKRKNTEKESSILDSLATGGPESFDMKKWSRAELGQAFPLTSEGVRALLDEQRYREVVDALRERFPDTEAVGVAAGDAGLQEYAKTKSPQCRIRARKALMVQHWLFKGRAASRTNAFWRELSVTSTARSYGADSSKIENVTGVLLDGAWVRKGKASAFIQRQLEINVLMESLAKGQSPIIKKVGTEAESLRKAILAELEEKYGVE